MGKENGKYPLLGVGGSGVWYAVKEMKPFVVLIQSVVIRLAYSFGFGPLLESRASKGPGGVRTGIPS